MIGGGGGGVREPPECTSLRLNLQNKTEKIGKKGNSVGIYGETKVNLPCVTNRG